MRDNEFLQKLLSDVLHNCYQFHAVKTDYLRLGTKPPVISRQHVKNVMFQLASKRLFFRKQFDVGAAVNELLYVIEHGKQLDNAYHLLRDCYSRQLLIDLWNYKILGPRHVKLPINNRSYWKQYKALARDYMQDSHKVETSCGWLLKRYKQKGQNGDIEFLAHPLGVLNGYILEQYAYRRSGRNIEVQPGDTIIDGGGCWGETALYFADKAGPAGKVYCFEFVPTNLEVLEQNFAMNPQLAQQIKVIQKPLWSHSGKSVSYDAFGPGTTITKDKAEGTGKASTMSIDDLVQEEGINRVDFIKMDIEGAELDALHGAEKTLRAFKPQLAIASYHKPEDFFAIPEYLHSLGLGYEFFLDHYTTLHEETMLYAQSKTQ